VHATHTGSRCLSPVSGRVLGPDGEPMPGATALLSYLSTEPWRVVVSHTTDDTGAFSFSVDDAAPLQPATVAGMKPSFAIAWASCQHGDRIDLQVSRQTVTCRGVCIDVDGNPLSGSTVALTDIIRPYENHWSQHELSLNLTADSPIIATTDEHGAFAISDLPPGSTIGLRASAPGCEARSRHQVASDADGLRIYTRYWRDWSSDVCSSDLRRWRGDVAR